MNRRAVDRLVILVLALVLVVGLYASWRASQRNQAVNGMMGSMMGGSMGGQYGAGPVWYTLAALVVVIVVGGLYVIFRENLDDFGAVAGPARDTTPASSPPSDADGDRTTSPSGTSSAGTTTSAGRRLLDVLPEDERRVLEPVIVSPGLTQIELRDRADFSKSKISQTVSALEKRGLLYRERQGRTYRVYPDESVLEE